MTKILVSCAIAPLCENVECGSREKEIFLLCLFLEFNPFPSKRFPIDEYNHLALDRVKSVSALSAHSAVKGLTNSG